MVLTTCQITLQDETEAHRIMGRRVGPHFGWNYLDAHILGLLLKFDLTL